MLKKTHIFTTLVLFFVFFTIISCNKRESISIHTKQENLPYLHYSLQIPEYTEYSKLSKIISETLLNDFEKYRDFAQLEWEYDPSDVYTYRTLFEDHSNKDYINVLIKKYIFCGPGIEDEYFITFCWDKKQNKLVTIEDVTGLTSMELMEYSRKYIKAHLKDVDPHSRDKINASIDALLDENLKKYTQFAASKKSATLYFATGDAAPKGFGPQEVIIKLLN